MASLLRNFRIQASERYQSRAIVAFAASRHSGQLCLMCCHSFSPHCRCFTFCNAALYSSLDLRPKPLFLAPSVATNFINKSQRAPASNMPPFGVRHPPSQFPAHELFNKLSTISYPVKEEMEVSVSPTQFDTRGRCRRKPKRDEGFRTHVCKCAPNPPRRTSFAANLRPRFAMTYSR